MEGRDIADLELEFEVIDGLVAAEYGADGATRVDRQIVSSAVGLLMLGSVVFRGYMDARGLAGVSEPEIVDEMSRLAGSLHAWNRRN